MADKQGVLWAAGFDECRGKAYECGSWLFKYHASLCRRGEANASSCGI